MIPIVKIPRKIPIMPRRSAFTRWFWERLEQGVLETTECEACGKISFPPKQICPRCHSDQFLFKELSGRGVVYTRTRVHMTPTRLIPLAPLSVGIVDLEEGVRVACTFLDRKVSLEIGDRIQMVSMKFKDGVLFGAQAAINPGD
ncbi:MAG: OB-fold domain-containing protein [Arenicella sp.]|jgi:uncharacterized OB-fold protein|nr:OB-fold domain-containing protein [Arenicella sp.]